MKILHCVYTVDPVTGGAYEAARQFSLSHLEMGHEVEMASLDLPGAPYLESLPFRVHPLGATKVHAVASSKYRYGYSPKFLSWLKGNHHRYDVVIVNGIWQYHSFAAWKVLRNTDTPYFVYVHGMLDPWFKRTYRLKHLKKWLFWPWSDYRAIRDANAALFTCEDEKIRSYESFWLYKCHPRVATLGITRPVGDADAQRETFLNAYPMLRDRPFLLFLSRIHKKKGCMHLIDAFGELARENKELYLMMAGPGVGGHDEEVRARLETYGKEIASRVIWPGMLEGDLKWGAYHAADAFILPSHTENFGIVVVEALACGLPVLISREVNIWREIIEDGAGFAESDDKEGTIRLIRQWQGLSPAEKNAVRQRALDCYNRRFEIGEAAQNLIHVLEEEIARKRPPARKH